MDRVQIPVPLTAGRAGQRRGTRVRLRLLEEQLGWADDLRGLIRQRPAAGEAEDGFVVRSKRDGLQRVRVQVCERRQRKLTTLRLDIEEPRNVGDRVGDAGAVVVVVREALVRLVPRPRGGHAQLEPVGKRLVHVGADVLAVVERAGDDAAVVHGPGRQEIPGVLRSAADVEVGAVGEWLVPSDLSQVIVVRDPAAYTVRAHRRRVVRKEPRYGVEPGDEGWAGREDARRRPALQLEKAQALRDGRPRLAGLTAFGLDDDDAIRGFRAVDGRRGGAAQHLDRLDVVGVHIGEAVDRIVLQFPVPAIGGAAGHREQAGGQRRVAVDHAIHHEERVGIADHRVVAAQLDLGATARCPRVL